MTTISYKDQVIGTANNETKTLKTQGKYCEADIVIEDAATTTAISGSWTPSGNTLRFELTNLPFKPKTMSLISASTYIPTTPDHIVSFVFDTDETVLPLMGVGIDEGTRKVFTYGASAFRTYFTITDNSITIDLTGSEYSTAFLGGYTYKYTISSI